MELEKLINRITDIAEDKGWSVYTETKDALVEFEFSQSTDFGQDFSFSASMNDGNIYTLIESVNDYYEGYDPDEEALLWIGPDGHGRNGAPYRLSDIIKDMEQAESMVNELLETLIEVCNTEELWRD